MARGDYFYPIVTAPVNEKLIHRTHGKAFDSASTLCLTLS